MASRKENLAKLKKGPGVFVYEGGAYDTECVPTLLRRTKSEPKFDDQGMPVLDRAGRQLYEKTGDVIRGSDGKPVLGGPPKIVKKEFDPYAVSGGLFHKDKPVTVGDPRLALKLRGLACFKEVEAEDEVKESSDLASLKKAELLDLAKNEGLEVPEGASKAELVDLLEKATAA
jgi:hypothetical protein